MSDADSTSQPEQVGTLWAAAAHGSQARLPFVDAFTRGEDPELDQALLPFDLRGTIAHVRGLARVGLLKSDDADTLVRECEALLSEARAGTFRMTAEFEDCHSAIEAELTKRHGDLGRRVHTARSRNDQVLTALRLLVKDALAQVDAQAAQLARSFETVAARADADALQMPGFSHGQPGMPVPVSMWLLALRDGLEDDRRLLGAVRGLVDQSPLGSGAGFGPPPPIKLDRAFTAGALGFERVQENPFYCQHSRPKFDALVLEALATLMRTVARFAADGLLFSTPAYAYLTLADAFTTGSSLMPNKRNQDVLELLRARAGQVAACADEVRAIGTATLTSGYHRDYQALKRPLLRGIAFTIEALPVATAAVESITFDRERLAESVSDPALHATAAAHKLVVEQGIPFRDAYRQVKQALAGKANPPEPRP